MDKAKKLGVLGGMGPQASAFFYNNIIKHTKAEKDQDHLDMVIINHASMPDRTNSILRNDTEEIRSLLIKDIKDLESMGCSEIAITCNTSHYFLEDLQKAADGHIINMISEAVRYALEKEKNAKKLGIIGTDGTLSMGLYKKACRDYGVEAIYPSKENQKKVMSIIYDDIKAGGTGDQMIFMEILDQLKAEGCDVIILACTEISAYKEYHGVPDICVDAMDVLVREAILRCGKEYTE